MSELTGCFVVPHSHPALAGHFPGHPVVPGVLVLDEVLAVLCGDLGAHEAAAVAMPKVRFLKAVKPGQRVAVTLARGRSPYRWAFKCTVDGECAALGELEVDVDSGHVEV